MAGIINFIASDFLQNTTGTGESEYTKQSSYSYSKDTFKKLWYRRYTTNRDTNMVTVGSYNTTTNPIQIEIDGTTTSAAELKRGQKIALEGTGGYIGTVRGVGSDANLANSGNLLTTQFILNSLSQDLPNDTKLYYTSDEAIIFIQFDTEGDLVDRDQVYMFVDQKHVKTVVDTISKTMNSNDYTVIQPNTTTGIGRHISYISVIPGESSLLD
tara:strand:+ start:485 stop:1123 length:639 start_codon:yes stop_codon:yes gene_type:complete